MKKIQKTVTNTKKEFLKMAVQMVKEASTWIMLSGKEKAEE